MFLVRVGVSARGDGARRSRRRLGRRRELETVEQRIERGLVDFDVRRIRSRRRRKREQPLVQTLGEHACPGRVGEQNLHQLTSTADEDEERAAARLVAHALPQAA